MIAARLPGFAAQVLAIVKGVAYDTQGRMLLRDGPDRGVGNTRGHGLLSLPLLPFVVGIPSQCVYPLEPNAVQVTAGAEQLHVPEDGGE